VGRLFAVLAVYASALGLASPALAPTLAFTRTEHVLTMGDGVSLAATLYRQDGVAPAGGWPAVLILHGLGGSRRDVEPIAREFALQGYFVLTVDARGHGASGGLSTLAGARETADYAAALTWLRARPGVSDQKIGAMGFSLGGASVWKLLTAKGTRLAAAVPVTTWTSLYDALLPQGFARAGFVAYLRSLLPDDRWDPEIRSLADDALESRNLPRIWQLARDRSVRDDLGQIRTPVFMIQGRRDYAFDMDQALSAFGRLRGKKRIYLGDLGGAPAANPPAEQGYYVTQARLWFDRFLKGVANGIDTHPPVELAPDPWTGRTTQYAGQPGRRVLRLRFRGRATIDGAGRVVRTVAPSKRLNETFGAGLVGVSVASTTQWPHVVAVLSAIAPGRPELVISAGGASTPVLSANPRLVTIRLLSQATTIPRGARFRLTIGGVSAAQVGDNLLYPLSVPSMSRLSVGEAKVVLPVLKRPVSR
jgi:pimeloyl-ACP methyl ester carboxylesterase